MLRNIIIFVIMQSLTIVAVQAEVVTVVSRITLNKSGGVHSVSDGGVSAFGGLSKYITINGHYCLVTNIYDSAKYVGGNIIPNKLVRTVKCLNHNVTVTKEYTGVVAYEKEFNSGGVLCDQYTISLTYDNDLVPNCSGDDPDDDDDDDPDDDDDDDPPPECTCGACCRCKCTCGNWSGKSCVGACGHAVPNPGEYATCECHHVEPPDEGCCEHHKKDFKPPPNVDFSGASSSLALPLPPIFDMQLGNGGFNFPGVPNRPVPPSASNGDSFSGSIPSFDSPGEAETKPLEYFEREGEFELPKFKYEDVFDTLMDKFEGKLPLKFVESFKNASAGNFQLKFTIDITLPQPFEVRIGPHTVDVGGYITQFANTNFSNTIRLILLCGVCIYFIVSILAVIFS